MAFPQRLLNDGETVVVSTRTHPEALALPLLATTYTSTNRRFAKRSVDDGA